MPATDEERFAEIYRDHVGILMKTTQAFVADRADRDDLFQ
jgi:DNA-directed RNA polymerase specialized sigma24 family protein